MSERFYINCPLALGPVTLTGAEARHLAGVCRARPGDAVCLFNGDGREYPARVVAVERRSVTLEIQVVESPDRERKCHLEVAAPLPKGDRAQFLVEKLTELGVGRFVPLRTRRSVVHPRDAKPERLERWVIEACKQCGRNVLMQIDALTDWADYCQQAQLPSLRFLADPQGEPISPLDQDQPLALAVGPEGGWTEEELSQATGWRRVGLGPRILRVETAALALVALATVR